MLIDAQTAPPSYNSVKLVFYLVELQQFDSKGW
jgi:hypothetical protein